MTQDRREFLRKLAKGAVWTAPVVTTFALPKRLHGINLSGFNSRMDPPAGSEAAPQVPGSEAPGSTPPGSDPPWTEPPGGSGG